MTFAHNSISLFTTSLFYIYYILFHVGISAGNICKNIIEINWRFSPTGSTHGALSTHRPNGDTQVYTKFK